MKPKNRNKRLTLIAICGVALMLGTVFLMSALKENTQFFYNPSELQSVGFVAQSESIRVGGLVVPGSVSDIDGLTKEFLVTDFVEGMTELPADAPIVKVRHTGVVPDLFKEGKGVVVGGSLQEDGTLLADEVLAKHDENYQPKKDYS